MAGTSEQLGADLFAVLDGAVKRVGRRRDLIGKIAVGARTEEGTRWWGAELGESISCGMIDAPARDVDAALFLDDRQSHVFGDRALLQRIFDHYLGKADLISVRAGGTHRKGISRGTQNDSRR